MLPEELDRFGGKERLLVVFWQFHMSYFTARCTLNFLVFLIVFLLLNTARTAFGVADSFPHLIQSYVSLSVQLCRGRGLVRRVSIQTQLCLRLFQSPSVCLAPPLSFNLIIHWREHNKSKRFIMLQLINSAPQV